jgi:hypothetical protein
VCDEEHYTALMPATGWRAVFLLNGYEYEGMSDSDEPDIEVVPVVAFGAISYRPGVLPLILDGFELTDVRTDSLVCLLEPSLSEEEANAAAETAAIIKLRALRRHWQERAPARAKIEQARAKHREVAQRREVAR